MITYLLIHRGWALAAGLGGLYSILRPGAEWGVHVGRHRVGARGLGLWQYIDGHVNGYVLCHTRAACGGWPKQAFAHAFRAAGRKEAPKQRGRCTPRTMHLHAKL